MSQEAQPIVEAYIEEGKKHEGQAFTDAFNKRVEEIKKESIVEKKKGSLSYRDNLIWAGIKTQEDFDKKLREIVADYGNGNFFMERLGRYREVDLPLTITVVELRRQWIKEYGIKTAPEFMILDMALASYFHFIRLNEQVNNVMASIEWDYFAMDAPSFRKNYYEDKYGRSKDNKVIAEELAYRLNEVLQPVLDRFNRMFIRNLKALRDLRRGNIQLNIGNVGQVNIGDKQINVENQA